MKSFVKDYFWITLSSFLTVLGVKISFQATGIAPGGITGLAIVLVQIIPISLQYMTLFISVPVLTLSTFFLGKNFGIKTLYITIITSVFLSVLPLMHIIKILALPSVLANLLDCLIGGLLIGSSIAIAIYHHCATGGTDMIAMLINKIFPNVVLSKIIFVLDSCIIIASGLIQQDIMITIYSLISLFVIVKTISTLTIFLSKTFSRELNLEVIKKEA